MSAGEEKDIDVTFPADYHAEELAGKPVVFKVKVHEVKETVVPEKDDEFVKDVSEFDTVAELRADIEKRIRDEKQAGIDRAFATKSVPCGADSVRLACVRHAASVRPEPGSNSLKFVSQQPFDCSNQFQSFNRSLTNMSLTISVIPDAF